MLGKEVRPFKDLMVWQRSHQLFLDVVRDMESFKKDVALKIILDQIIRSIGSISSNIAEGFNLRTTRQYLSFLDIARRSAAESENWFFKLRDIGQLERDKAETRINECVETNKMLYGLVNRLKKKIH